MLQSLKEALAAISGAQVYHFRAIKATAPYIVWAEDGADDLQLNGVHVEKAATGTVDLFTKTENDPLIASIEGALDSVDGVWSLNSVQYEQETGLIHYEWIFEV